MQYRLNHKWYSASSYKNIFYGIGEGLKKPWFLGKYFYGYSKNDCKNLGSLW